MNTWVRCLLLIKMAVIGAPEVKYFKSVSCIFFPKSLISNDLFLFTIFFHSPNINVCTFFPPFTIFFIQLCFPALYIFIHSSILCISFLLYFLYSYFSLFADFIFKRLSLSFIHSFFIKFVHFFLTLFYYLTFHRVAYRLTTNCFVFSRSSDILLQIISIQTPFFLFPQAYFQRLQYVSK